jgi:purine-nucleoside phosphorylase
MMKNYFQKVTEAKDFIKAKVKIVPKVMLVLSGGLTEFVDKIGDAVTISSSDVPHFPKATAEGHSGRMIFGKIGGLPLVALQGRFHFYEGHKMEDVVFPVFVMNALGAKTLVVTNAVGGINESFRPGDIMLINDHINFMGANPLIGISTQRSENQFPDMTDAYSLHLQKLARDVARDVGVNLREGVYIATSGPTYDAAGLSVVPEIIAAKFLNMDTLGFSCIANLAADLHPGGMSHKEVLANMKEMEGRLVKLLLAVVPKLG